MNLLSINLVLTWAWLGLGIVSGMVLGMQFHRDDWRGGYGSLSRRLYRLCHIAFFGMGFTNFVFWATALGSCASFSTPTSSQSI